MFEFLNNSPFVTYESVDTPKVRKLSLPLGDVDLHNGLYVGSDGKIQVEDDSETSTNEPRIIVNNTEEIPEIEYQTNLTNMKGDKSKAMQFFMSKGLSQHMAAGIVGNLIQESSLNTTAVGDGGKAFGIAQWHPDRQKGLKQLAKKNGTDISDFNTQLEYVWQELNDTHKSALDGLLKSKNAEQATRMFMVRFEKPNKDPNVNKIFNRIKIANSLMS